MTDDKIVINLCKDLPDEQCEVIDFDLDKHLSDLIQSIADKENKSFEEVLTHVLQETIENIVKDYGDK
jgi:hypothetical protein